MDSLYQSQLSLKDAVMQTQQDKYDFARSAFDQSLEQLQSQSAQLNRLTSQVKRQTRKNKLAAAVAFIAAAIVAGILLAHWK